MSTHDPFDDAPPVDPLAQIAACMAATPDDHPEAEAIHAKARKLNDPMHERSRVASDFLASEHTHLSFIEGDPPKMSTQTTEAQPPEPGMYMSTRCRFCSESNPKAVPYICDQCWPAIQEIVAENPAVASYQKHFGPRALQAAEADWIASAIEALELLLSRVGHAPNPLHTEAYPDCQMCDALAKARAVLAQKGAS